MKKEIEKECGNCRYYSQHYSKQGTKFDIFFCGHCTNPQNRGHNKSKPKLCEKWEDISVKKEERKTSIIDALYPIIDLINNLLKL